MEDDPRARFGHAFRLGTSVASVAAHGERSQRWIRLARAGLAVLLVTTVGTWGFWTLSDGRHSVIECLYMTVISISTVGFNEVIPISSDAMRLFSMGLILLGGASLVYFLTAIAAFFLEGELIYGFWRRRLARALDRLDKHVVVCGLGRVGAYAFNELQSSRWPVVGLDREASRVEALLLEHGDRILFAVGDVFLEETLLAARLERAHALVVALADDRDNLLLCVTARQVNPSIRLVVRLVDADNASLFEGAHADAIVHSPRVAAKTIASDLLNPALSDFTHRLITSESHRKPLELLTVSPDDAAVGQPLDALVFGHKCGGMIVAHRRAGDARFAFRPEGSRLLEGGDELLLLASREERRHRSIAPRTTTSNGASPLEPPEARHAVLAGAGAVGRALAKELRHRGIRVSVIERDAAKLALLRDALGDDPDLHLVCGDVYDKHALSEAGLERAWAFVSALQAVRDNLFLAATVHHQHPHLRIVARVGSRREARRMEAFGAEAFNPGAIGGVHLGRLAIHPELVAFADGLEASLERTEALAILPVTRPGLDGSRLRELPTGDLGAVVVGLRRKKSGHFVYHPDPAMRLSVGGAVVALGEAHALEALSAFLGG